MKQLAFFVAIAVSSMAVMTALAQEIGNGGMTARERAYARKAATFGGVLQRPNAHPGRFAFVNAQGRVAASNLTETVDFLRKALHANIVLEDGKSVTAATAGSARKAIKADVAVFLVDDKAMPDMLLVSPESKWAIVNMAALTTDNPAAPFAAARLNKEMSRAFSYVAGGCGSEFKGNLLDYIGRPDQLDSYAETRPPMDVLAKVSQRLPMLGVTPQRLATYQQACKEGWAPAPTNDVQKAIWERVKADKERGPTNPITIQPPKAKK